MSERMIMSRKITKIKEDTLQVESFIDYPLEETRMNQCFARHFLDAFNGTVDDEGEDFEDWLIEVTAAFQGKYGPVLRKHSFYLKKNEKIIGRSTL